MAKNKLALLTCVFFALATNVLFAQTVKPDALKSYNNGNYKEAIEICEQELKVNPSNMDSYTVLCWALVANKQYHEAEQRATEAYNLKSNDERLIEVLGESKYFLDKNDEALTLFQRYVSKASENAARLGRVYYYMGEIYIKQARYEHADIAITTAVKNEPLRDFWWTRLGYAREMGGHYTEAVSAYDKALSLNSLQYDATRGKVRCQAKIR